MNMATLNSNSNSSGRNKLDRAVEILDCDLEAEVNALSVDELKQIALKALRLRCYDRARSNEYNRINAEKRRAYYHAVTKHKRRAKNQAAKQGDPEELKVDVRGAQTPERMKAPNAPKALH
jgi:hypothetical protein